MRNIPGWCIVLATVAILALLPVPSTAGRVVLKNEISGLPARKAKLAVRCWSNEDDLGWTVIKQGQAKSWEFVTMNMWPFKKTEFRCKFQSGLGTTNEDIVTVFSVREGFRKECDASSVDECVWVAKGDGFYQRRTVMNGYYFKKLDVRRSSGYYYFRKLDVRRSKWVWKW